MTQIRAAIYCRISRDKVGAGLGVERQEADCRALAASLGWDVVKVFPDNDISAYSGKRRPEYRQMLDAIAAGRIDGVLAWHADRLHRSTVELEHYIGVCEPRSVPTHTVKAGLLDLTTASGRMTARITGAVARHESEHRSERVCSQKRTASKTGLWTGGGRPFGYTRDGTEKVPSEADVIADGVRRALAGESVYSITKRWQAGVPPVRGGRWHAQNVTRILTRPRNAGLAAHKGEIVGTGAWPAIIEPDEYHAVTALLGDPSRSTYSGTRSLKWVGSGLYRCGRCGSDLRSASSAGRDGSTRRTYRCRSGRHVTINAEPVDEFVMATVCALLARDGAGLLPAPDDGTSGLHTEANTLRARLDQLADDFTDDVTGTLDKKQYGRQRDRVQVKLDAVVEALAARQTGSALDGIATAPDPAAAFREAPVARQRAVVDALAVVTIGPAKPGRRPKGEPPFDLDRVRVEPRNRQ